ncbi:hypothetical protein Q5425_21650 [Amycolatopsis sp. A133]|jgi:hypothetical protein|uniref:hypothetical protein n=1 Tax=Amycolatopsis sp. A133 TaxID=3064472 RepID=UPI0027FDC80A|nr:hypothetical protein [Amycolatopsis sp. A133]MDQ7806354.1 hypothetical protein [Amycolatopsis sp. A133]
MSDWSLSRAKARLDHRERLDELTARTRFEVRLHLNEPVTNGAYDELTSIFAIGHGECAALLAHHRLLPWWERALLFRYARRVHGKAITRSVGAVPAEVAPQAARAFGAEIAELAPGSGDTGAKYDLQGRGLLTVFRIAVGAKGETWPDRHEVATTAARNILTCAATFARRKPWHVVWPVYRVRGLRLWKL